MDGTHPADRWETCSYGMATCVGPFGKTKGHSIVVDHCVRVWVLAAWMGCRFGRIEDFGHILLAMSHSEVDEFRATYAIGGYDAVKALAAAHPNL